jgi:hypothetical protein
MNGLAWKELYDKFSAFAYVAKRQGFYVKSVQEMEYSLFEMCPYPRSYRVDKTGGKK